MCSAFGKTCKGFVSNQGTRTITLKSSFRGNSNFAAGISVFIKKTYVSVVNFTGIFADCADSLVRYMVFYVKIYKTDMLVLCWCC